MMYKSKSWKDGIVSWIVSTFQAVLFLAKWLKYLHIQMVHMTHQIVEMM